MKFLTGFFSVFLIAAASFLSAQEPSSKLVYRIDIDGMISPMTANHVEEAFAKALESKAQAVLMVLDTPGGFLESTRDIIKSMLNNPIPVIVFVSPKGARATSAGVFITLASDVAAMAPATHIGAAHPVSIGFGKPEDGQAKIMEEKITSDTAAYIESIAKDKHRNVEWAKQAVRKSVSIDSEEALRLKVIDLLADDIPDLFQKIQGKTISKLGKNFVLDVKGATVFQKEFSFKENVLKILSNPNVAYVLFIIGVYAWIFELKTAGAGFGGVLGTICLVLAFLAMNVLPINYAGLLLLLVGLGLMAVDLFVHTGGLLTAGGLISFAIGSFFLIRSDFPFLQVSRSLIAAFVVFNAVLFVYVFRKVLVSQKLKRLHGAEGLVGESGQAKTEISKTGTVFVHGEYWTAESQELIEAGSTVEVVDVRHNVLLVKKK